MNKELNYLYELTKDDVKDYYMMDYRLYMDWKGKRVYDRHVRHSYLTSRQLAIITATMDWSYAEKFRVHSFRDLIEPVNKDGKTKFECEYDKNEFIPVCQKAEYIFDSRYRVTRARLINLPDMNKEDFKQGIYMSHDMSITVYSSLEEAA
jgi:hypothetical protein